ncbi:hypothetical protein CsSME_00011480 [Camellia sinensis var. sinensis]
MTIKHKRLVMNKKAKFSRNTYENQEYIFDLYSFDKVCILLHFRCHQIPFIGPRASIFAGQSGNAFYAAL